MPEALALVKQRYNIGWHKHGGNLSVFTNKVLFKGMSGLVSKKAMFLVEAMDTRERHTSQTSHLVS